MGGILLLQGGAQLLQLRLMGRLTVLLLRLEKIQLQAELLVLFAQGITLRDDNVQPALKVAGSALAPWIWVSSALYACTLASWSSYDQHKQSKE